MASKIVDGRKVLVGSKADPASDRYDPKRTGTIKLSQLNQSQPPAQLPPPQIAARTSPLDASLESIAKSLPEQARLKREASQANEEDSFMQFMDAQLSAPTETQVRMKAEKDSNLQELEANATQLSNDLLAEQERLRKEIERIETAPGTATASERDRQIAETRRVSLREQADIAITQLAAQGQFAVAQKYVDRAVQAEMEGVIRKIDAYKQIYERAQTLFTRDEQREFEIALADREREEELKVYEYKARLEQKIKQSDPLYQAQLRKAEMELAPPAADGKQLAVINDIDNILNNAAFDSTFGVGNILNRNFPGNPQYTLSAEINQLTSQLALAARGELKGQGQVSDFEGRLLRDAQTALRLNMNPADARQELANVKGAIRTSSGLTATVEIFDPETGESQVVNADQAGINNAIKDGLNVQYR